MQEELDPHAYEGQVGDTEEEEEEESAYDSEWDDPMRRIETWQGIEENVDQELSGEANE